jgi:hypothetical protein
LALLLPLIGTLIDTGKQTFFIRSATIFFKPLAWFSPDKQLNSDALAQSPLKDARKLAALGAWPWLYLIVPGQIILIAYILITHRHKTFRRKNDYRRLLKIYAEFRPYLHPILKTGIIAKKSSVEGPWAIAETPIQFLLKARAILRDNNQPVTTRDLLDPKTGLCKKDESFPLDLKYSPGNARMALVSSLGPLIHYPETALQGFHRDLALAFLAQGYDQKDLAYKILGELSYNWDPDTLKTHSPLAQKTNLKLSYPDIPRELQCHVGFQNPFFIALLLMARKNGILPTFLFIWLRPTDRTLFYVLNQLGGGMAWAEGAGAYSHYLAEEKAQTAINQPVVERAVKGLEKFLIKERWITPPPKNPEPADDTTALNFIDPQSPSQANPEDPNNLNADFYDPFELKEANKPEDNQYEYSLAPEDEVNPAEKPLGPERTHEPPKDAETNPPAEPLKDTETNPPAEPLKDDETSPPTEPPKDDETNPPTEPLKDAETNPPTEPTKSS